MFGTHSTATSMKCFILGISLLLGLLNSGTAQDEDNEDSRDSLELVLSNGSSPVLLPCSDPSPTQVTMVQWTFKPASGNNGWVLCRIDNSNPQCSSPLYPNIKLAEPNGFVTGNYSLWFTATMENAGIYDCFLYARNPKKVMIIRLMGINVSVTPAGPIPLGSSVSLTCKMTDPSYFNRIDWSIKNSRVTGEGIEIQWKLNKTLISKDKRRKFDFRSLNINKFQHRDAGCYTYTVKLKNGKSCIYSRLLEISGLAPTSLTTENPPTGTSDTPENSKGNMIIAGAVVGVALIALAIFLTVLLIKKKYKSEAGPSINVPLQRKKTEQDSSDLNSTYMGLNLEEQSVYSQLQR